MMRRFSHYTWQMLLLLLVISYFIATTRGQAQCGLAETISYPVDTSAFTLVQDYAARSPRHQGRFHTGEDWYGGRGLSYGQPVRAIAAGRVTYSYALGWGRDGGVVIIEHTFPDGSVAYSQYGHIAETDSVTFPQKFACVEAGEVIGTVGDARPAPHVHLEIRVNNPDVPGPGYTWADPTTEGWRDPGKFIINRQGWFHPAHEWHIEDGEATGPSAPPLLLNDNSLLYFDGVRLKRATHDGRVLWRLNLEKRAVALVGHRGVPLVVFADGTVQAVELNGGLGALWQADFAPDGPPLFTGETPLFHTSDDALAALDPESRSILWRVDDVPPFVRGHAAGAGEDFNAGLITEDNTILSVSRSGVQYRGQLRASASFATAPDGTLLVYTQRGLWRVDRSGTWSPTLEDAPASGGDSGAVLATDEGRIYLFDGATLYAYGPDGELLWDVPVQGIDGRTTLAQYGDRLLLATTHGHLRAVSARGRLCGQMRIYGDDRAKLWHGMGDDGVLRVAVGDHIMGLDWATFTGACG